VFFEENITDLDLELSSRCNASCPMCARNHHGGPVNPRLKTEDLDFQIIRSLPILSQIRMVNMCGNYGDPIMHPELLDILGYMHDQNNNMRFLIHTNGGVRGQEWWSELAKIPNLTVRFGIDGLSDTNHIYRKGVRWENLERNFSSFIKSGGNAEWKFIIFKHNQHQIDQAMKFAGEQGFVNFIKVKTNRFWGDTFPVYDRNLATIYHLEMATVSEDNMVPSNKHRSASGPIAKRTNKKPLHSEKSVSQWEEELGVKGLESGHSEITCYALKERRLYISARGEVYPCCQLAYLDGSGLDYNVNHAQAADILGLRDQISLKHHSLDQVLKSQFFTQIIQGWHQPNYNSGRMMICQQTCGGGSQPSLYKSRSLS
jgi:MoaA/NifB/PqqE/SkfB family radical SAM enzyme